MHACCVEVRQLLDEAWMATLEALWPQLAQDGHGGVAHFRRCPSQRLGHEVRHGHDVVDWLAVLEALMMSAVATMCWRISIS